MSHQKLLLNLLTHLCQKEQNESQEILKNQLIQKAQQYFTNIASIFELIEIQKICLFICSFWQR